MSSCAVYFHSIYFTNLTMFRISAHIQLGYMRKQNKNTQKTLNTLKFEKKTTSNCSSKQQISSYLCISR